MENSDTPGPDDTCARLCRERKMEALQRMAAGMGHDFNNILGAMEGYLSLILAGLAADDPLRPDIEELLKAEKRAAGIVKQLQLFSRKRSGIKHRSADLCRVAAKLAQAARALPGGKLEVILEAAAGPLPVCADEELLEQAMQAVLLNAAEAMPEGGRLLICARTASFPPGDARRPEGLSAGADHAALSISDTGAGMTREVMERAFEPFFTTKPRRVGGGLGLAAAYGVIRQNNGWLDVQSEPGKGSVFTAYFPPTEDR